MREEILNIANNLKQDLITLNDAKIALERLLHNSVHIKRFNGEVIDISSLSHSNINLITLEVLGEHNYITNFVNKGDKLEILQYR
jgi:hypothetical protein